MLCRNTFQQIVHTGTTLCQDISQCQTSNLTGPTSMDYGFAAMFGQGRDEIRNLPEKNGWEEVL